MLFLIGLGLESDDISVRALDAAKSATALYLDSYTSFLPSGYVERLEKAIGRKITALGRKDLEEEVSKTVAMAKERDVGLLVPGDPLIATTHHLIISTAGKIGVRVRVYHAPSAFAAAIGESGLDIYKFGPMATVPFWSESYKPTSFLDVIDKNLKNGEHTLLLLDIDQKERRPMSLLEAVGILKEAEAKRGGGLVTAGLRLIVLANVGREGCFIAYTSLGSVGTLANRLSKKVLSLIVPAKMSFAEEENLTAALSK